MSEPFEIYVSTAPGLEQALAREVTELGFIPTVIESGGLSFIGNWRDVWRANLHIRGAAHVLARIGSFRAFHLAQLDKRARKFPWSEILKPDMPLRVDVTCNRSKIYHDRAASQRITRAISDTLGVEITRSDDLRLLARIEDDLCTFSIDTSGPSLHRRGFKEFIGKAPMRENLAALLLRECGYDGQEPVLDPMCGSGTFVIEAAEIAMGLPPGRGREFAFESLANHDAAAWEGVRKPTQPVGLNLRFYGSDRDTGAIRGAIGNAERAGINELICFKHQSVSDLVRPDGPSGLVIINPPYGGRIGNKKPLFGLYHALGKTLMKRFTGWRVGLVTTEPALAKATELPFTSESPQILHGGLKIRLWQTALLS